MRMEDMVLVSVDDHVVEPPDMFDQHVSPKYKDRAPHVIRNEHGHDVWMWEGRQIPNLGLNAVSGRPPEDYGMEPTSYEQIRRGTWDSAARIADMNADGVLASLCFPSFPSFCGKLWFGSEDLNLALVMIRAYNDWHCDEWCGSHPGRLIPLSILPLWDPTLAAEELRRMARKGCHAFTMLENPESAGFPGFHSGDHWDPVWRAACDEDVVACIHIGTGKELPTPSLDTPIEASMAATPIAIANCASDIMFAEFPSRFPELKISLTEGGIGWVPYFLERCDYVHRQHSVWTHTQLGGRQPSEVFRDHFITCFFEDRVGIQIRNEIGIERICWECDYPHSDATWPNSPETVHRCLEGVPDDEVDAITHANALRLWNFDAFSNHSRETCNVGALRELASDVDISHHTTGQGSRPIGDQEKRVVTVGDVRQQLASAMDG
ncbi:amidohydrolase [Myxococcota bacterium]|nr:amidohydrolase [Myxococcota bacterium]